MSKCIESRLGKGGEGWQFFRNEAFGALKRRGEVQRWEGRGAGRSTWLSQESRGESPAGWRW